MSLFRERGYDGVGVAELAKAMGINPPSLYAAFASKCGLFEQAVEHYARGDGGFIADILDRRHDPEETIRQLLLQAADAFTVDRHCRGCLVMDGARNSIDPEARALTDAYREGTRELLVVWLTGQGLREAEQLADALMIGLAGLSAAARDGLSKDAIRAAAALLANGLIANLEFSAQPGH